MAWAGRRRCWACIAAMVLGVGRPAVAAPSVGAVAASAPAASAPAASAPAASAPAPAPPPPVAAAPPPVIAIPPAASSGGGGAVLAPHLAASTAMLALVVLGQGAVNRALPGGHPCPLTADGQRCDPARLLAIDRASLGHASPGWRQASDAADVVALAVPLVGGLADALTTSGQGESWAARLGTDAAVALEAVAVATFVTQTWKYAVRRPRPGLYRPGPATVEGALSFPSGHTTLAAAAVTAYATTFSLRHPASPWRWAPALVGVGVVGATATGRVLGGMHFATDVIAGALVGAASGLAVPFVHRRLLVTPVPPGSVGAGVAAEF